VGDSLGAFALAAAQAMLHLVEGEANHVLQFPIVTVPICSICCKRYIANFHVLVVTIDNLQQAS
jgi:hypothetical protein